METVGEYSETAKEIAFISLRNRFFAVRSGINTILTLLQRQPPIFRPVDFLLNQNAGTILWHAVTMTEEVIAIREGVGRAMTHRLIFLLIAFEHVSLHGRK